MEMLAFWFFHRPLPANCVTVHVGTASRAVGKARYMLRMTANKVIFSRVLVTHFTL